MVGSYEVEDGPVKRQALQGYPPKTPLGEAPAIHDRFSVGQLYLSTAEVGRKHQEAQEEGERAV